MTGLQHRYASLNRHYEAAWNDSWHFRRCLHAHQTLIEAANCAMPHGAGWYVVCVAFDETRELTGEEDGIVNEVRFGSRRVSALQSLRAAGL
jgi:hypothetical protein